MSQRSASLSLSAILLARSTVLEKAASNVSAMGSMGRSIGMHGGNRNAGYGSVRPMFNVVTSLQPDAVQPHAPGTGITAAKQRDIGDLGHIHEPVPRTVAQLFQRKLDGAPLARAQFRGAVEPVAERPAMAEIVYAQAHEEHRVVEVLDVDDQRLVAAPVG